MAQHFKPTADANTMCLRTNKYRSNWDLATDKTFSALHRLPVPQNVLCKCNRLLSAGRNALKLLEGRTPSTSHPTTSTNDIAPSLATALVLLGNLQHIDLSFAGAFVHLHCSALDPLSNGRSLTIDSDMMTGGNATSVSCMTAVSSLYLLSGRMQAETLPRYLAADSAAGVTVTGLFAVEAR